MIFRPLGIDHSYLVLPDVHEDERGTFAQVWSQQEFAERGLTTEVRQVNTSRTRERGTVRGLHWQSPPHEEAKLVLCSRGAIYDVIVDLRPSSPTYAQWRGTELVSQRIELIYVPEGCAHGYQALTDGTEVVYLASRTYEPAAERGLRYDDTSVGISWPVDVTLVSEKDGSWPDLEL